MTGYFVLPDKNVGQAIFHFENAHYININRTFKAKTENKLSLSKIVVYLIRVPNDDLVLDKFIMIDNEGFPVPYISLQLSSDPSGSTETPLNHVNHPGYDDGVSLCVNMGGALADSSFFDISDPPMICFATPRDNKVPYNTGIVFPFGLIDGIFLFETAGSYYIIERAQELGVNDVFSSISGDPFSAAAAYTASHPNAPDMPVSSSEGLNGLMPFNRPSWENPFGTGIYEPENAPWDYWDAEYWSTIAHPSCPSGTSVDECNFHVINSIDNQDISLEKANIYLDSVMGYVLPRAYLALNLSQDFGCTTGTDKRIKGESINFEVFPNPSK